MRSTRSAVAVIALVAGLSLMSALPAWAHPHAVDQNGDGKWTDENGNGVRDPGEEPQLANGQNHGPFTVNGDGYAETQTDEGDPAAYGIETAHHGPDSGQRGKSDGKYQTDATATSGSSGPGSDDNNPAIQ